MQHDELKNHGRTFQKLVLQAKCTASLMSALQYVRMLRVVCIVQVGAASRWRIKVKRCAESLDIKGSIW